MRKIKDRLFWESAKYNAQSFMHYYTHLTELAISSFEWHNLPPGIDARFLELTLYGDGQNLFFYDDVMGFMALRCTLNGRLNPYDIPTQRTAYTSNGYMAQLNESNSVIIYNNLLHTNSIADVELYSKRLWDLDRTIDINVRAQKTPILLSCDDTQKLTLQNLYKQYDGNEPVIHGYSEIKADALKVLHTDAPYVADKLFTLKTQIWNEALTMLGIANVNNVKKERLISDEVIRNLGGTIASRYSRLAARQQACKQINDMFSDKLDREIWCEFKDSVDVINTGNQDLSMGV